MKKSEAKIIVYLSQVQQDLKYARPISAKLKMDYNYLLNILFGMKSQGLILPVKTGRKVIYILTKKANVEEAKKLLNEVE